MMNRSILLTTLFLTLAACTNGRLQYISTSSPSISITQQTPDAPAVSTHTPRPSSTLTTLPTSSPTPTQLLTPTAVRANLPRPLYLLIGDDYREGDALWVLKPGDTEAERLNPPAETITYYDVWSEDGRLCYGTQQGKLFVHLPGESPRLLLDTAIGSPYHTKITGVSWSPDGKQLAYTVDYKDYEVFQVPFPSKPSGIWVTNLDGSESTWLLSNNLLSSDSEIVNEFRLLDQPKWSPDGNALMVHYGHWEGSEQVWFDPIRPVPDDRSLNRSLLSSGPWSDGTWTSDGQGVLLSGLEYSDYSHLLWVRRDGQQSKIWVDGKENNLWVHESLVINDGIAFIAYSSLNYEGRAGLFYGRLKNGEFLWSRVDPYPICEPKKTINLAQGPDDAMLTLLCDRNELSLIALPENITTRIDLTPFLQKLDAPVLEIKWGIESSSTASSPKNP